MLKQAQNDRFKLKYRLYMIFYRKIEKKLTFYFVPGIILDHFSYPKSIFRYRNSIFYEILPKKIDQKICFVYKNRFLDLKQPEKTCKKNKEKLPNRPKTPGIPIKTLEGMGIQGWAQRARHSRGPGG